MKHYLSKFENIVRECWDKAALCNYNGEHFTFGEVAVRIARFHTIFEKLGVRKGDKIAICAKNSARWANAFLAVNTYEAVVVPILSDFLPESVAKLTGHSESVILFTDAEIWNKIKPEEIPSGLRCVINCSDDSLLYGIDSSVSDAYAAAPQLFDSKYPGGFSKDDVSYPSDNGSKLAVINYTSGTTSAPKGVMISYNNLSNIVDFAQVHQPNTPEYNIVSMLPLAHMYGMVVEFLYPFCSGCAVYFLGKTPSPNMLLKAMGEVRPYLVVTVPLVMEKVYKTAIKPVVSKWYMKILLNLPGISGLIYSKIAEKFNSAFGGNVQHYIMGGAALNPEAEKHFRKMHIKYTVGYGMTEASPLLCWESWDKFAPGSCGKPCHEMRVDSEDPLHIAGEIQAKGPNICMGYFNNPEANSMLFTEDGWMHTGDLGIFDKEGNLYIKGRSKSMILTANGQNVYPEELEAIINAQAYVSESVAVDRSGKIVALIYLDKDAIKAAKLDSEAVSDLPEKIRLASNRHLPSYSQIAKVEVMTVPFEKTPKMSIKRFLYK